EVAHHVGGTYVCIEGPAFSTRAESQLYRSWGGTVIGMTNLQEAKLAREAEMCFATIALATDYDCWHEAEAEVTVEGILAVMARNIENSRRLLSAVVADIDPTRPCTCQDALQDALLTPVGSISAEVKADLAPILGRYLPEASD
ncbi:MAG: S-methyl-5'-thioadenosine phosphorylase, partial [Gammaproteobacteria bacterium]|nr:S-methyl-5'-thioadenosine phosphorylase [Gammaproteobacteria bacterium]